MSRSSSALDTLIGWMRCAADSGNRIEPEQVRVWIRAVEVSREPAGMQPSDRVNAAEADMATYGIGQLVKFLAEKAPDSATLTELPKIDEAASTIIDLAETLSRGVARPVPPQNLTGA